MFLESPAVNFYGSNVSITNMCDSLQVTIAARTPMTFSIYF